MNDTKRKTEPLYKHDCTHCNFLGTFKGSIDLYYHEGWDRTVIARYSDEGSDYASGICFMTRPELQEAKMRAMKELGIDFGEYSPLCTVIEYDSRNRIAKTLNVTPGDTKELIGRHIIYADLTSIKYYEEHYPEWLQKLKERIQTRLAR